MVSLTTNQAAEMENNTLCFIALAKNSTVGVLQRRKLLLVAFALALKFLGNLLLENQCFEGIVTLLLCARETCGEARRIILLLINEDIKASVFTLVVLDLDLKILSLLGQLFSESLEFEELESILVHKSHDQS